MLGDDLVKLLEAASRSIAQRAENDAEIKAALGRIGRWLVDLAERLPDHDEMVKQEPDAALDSHAPEGRTRTASPASESQSSTAEQARRIGEEEPTIGVETHGLQSVGVQSVGVQSVGVAPARPRLIAPAPTTITGPRVVSMPSGPPLPAPPARSLDLALIVKRCRLKSEACRWAITRRRRLAEGADFKAAISPTDHDLVERAKAMEQCYLWVLDPYGVMPPDDPVLSVIDACYTNLADAASLVMEVQRSREENGNNGSGTPGSAGSAGSAGSGNGGSGWPGIEEPVRLLAEAQSALRVALSEAGLRADQDQIDAFAWLKEFTYAERIYLDRFMRLDNAADPQRWGELHESIERLRDAMDEASARAARRTKFLNRARYHARKLDDGDPWASGPGAGLDDWRKIMAAIDELVEDGVPPSDLEIREILLPLVDEIPENIELPAGRGASQAVREVDRYLASREAAREIAPPPVREPTKDVRKVASLLRGRAIVLIGGDERPEAGRAIERAFELSRLRWVSAKPHQSTTTFEPEVAREETALVMLAIRFSSHSFEGVKAICDKHGKPFVRLPGGYGVNQVARQILMQVGNRLAG